MVEIDNNTASLVKRPPESVFRRQDAPSVYDMNASIYIWRREALFKYDTVFTKKTSLYVMPEKRSIDIDTEEDLELVIKLIQK